jgi:hypothetical protein
MCLGISLSNTCRLLGVAKPNILFKHRVPWTELLSLSGKSYSLLAPDGHRSPVEDPPPVPTPERVDIHMEIASMTSATHLLTSGSRPSPRSTHKSAVDR